MNNFSKKKLSRIKKKLSRIKKKLIKREKKSSKIKKINKSIKGGVCIEAFQLFGSYLYDVYNQGKEIVEKIILANINSNEKTELYNSNIYNSNMDSLNYVYEKVHAFWTKYDSQLFFHEYNFIGHQKYYKLVEVINHLKKKMLQLEEPVHQVLHLQQNIGK